MWLASFTGGSLSQDPCPSDTRLMSRHASAVQVTAFGCFTGTAACLPFAGQLLYQLGSVPVSDTLQTVYLGLFPTTLGFTTWAYALARTTSGRDGRHHLRSADARHHHVVAHPGAGPPIARRHRRNPLPRQGRRIAFPLTSRPEGFSPAG